MKHRSVISKVCAIVDLNVARNRLALVSLFCLLTPAAATLFLQAAKAAHAESSVAGGPPGGDVNTIAIEPRNPKVIYVGTESGGVYKSTDKGATWAHASAGLPYDGETYTLAIDASHPSTLYAGTGDGVYKTTNGGENWAAVSAKGRGHVVSQLFVTLSNPPMVYTSDGEVIRRDDGGATAYEVRSVHPWTYIHPLAVDPADPRTIYASVSRPNDLVVHDGWHGNGLYRSTDGGQNWTQLNSLLVDVMSFTSRNPTTIYAGTETGVVKTSNHWKTWVKCNSAPPGLGFINLTIDPASPTVLYAIRSSYSHFNASSFMAFKNPKLLSRIFKSADGGNTWTQISSFAARVLAIDPSDSSTLYAGTADGILKTTDGGANWRASNVGLLNARVRVLALNPKSPSTIFAGTSSGIFKSSNGGGSWANVNFPDIDRIAALAIAPSNPTIAYAGIRNEVFKTTDEGQTWVSMASFRRERTVPAEERVSSLAVDPLDPSVVYAGTNFSVVYKSTDGGKTWKRGNSPLDRIHGGSLILLLIDPANPQTIYAGTNEGGVFKSADAGQSWIIVTPESMVGPVVSGVDAIVVDLADPAVFYAGTTGGGVFKSFDGGRNWASSNFGIGNISVEALAIDPSNPATVYAGTYRSGVFKSTDRGKNWTAISSGLPPGLGVWSLAIDAFHPLTVYAGTGGAGVFKSTNGGANWLPTGSR